MRKFLAAALFALASTAAFGQTYPPIPVTGYINEQGNLFAMTHTPGASPFHIQIQTNVVDFSPSIIQSIGVVATGQNGKGACSGRGCLPPTYATLFPWLLDASGVQYPSVWLMTSTPVFNPDGTKVLVPDLRYPYANCTSVPPIGCMQLYNDVAPAVDGAGNPVVLTPSVSLTGTITGWSLSIVVPLDVNGVPLYQALPPGTYNLHEVGTSCGGYLCRIPGVSTLETRTAASYWSPPPPPPTCGTPTTPPCDN